jgi:hypothetical protein
VSIIFTSLCLILGVLIDPADFIWAFGAAEKQLGREARKIFCWKFIY